MNSQISNFIPGLRLKRQKKTPSKIDGVPMAEIVETGNFKLATNIQKKIELRIYISIYILVILHTQLCGNHQGIAFFR